MIAPFFSPFLPFPYRYDAFGKTIGETGTVDNKYLFAGEQFDEGLGDYYLRQRYYDVSTGRFTRRDEYEGSAENPATLHKYIYGNGNPVTGIDPTGFFTITEVSQRWVDEAQKLAQQATQGATLVENFRRTSASTINLIKAVAQAYAKSESVAASLSRMFKIPMLVTGWEMPQTAEHITRSLLFSGYTKNNSSGSLFGSNQLPVVLSHQQEDINGHDWYHSLPVATNKPPGTSVDEYPYAATVQGGERNYNNNMVSLKAVGSIGSTMQPKIKVPANQTALLEVGKVSETITQTLNQFQFIVDSLDNPVARAMPKVVCNLIKPVS